MLSNNSISQTEEKSTPSEQKNSSKIRESRTPVQFEVKEYVDNNNRLYLAVALTKIETSVMDNTVLSKDAPTYLLPVSDISIADLISKINTKDEKFFKYIPNELLNEDQLKAKRLALEKEDIKYGRKSNIKHSHKAETNKVIVSRGQLAKLKANYEGEKQFNKKDVESALGKIEALKKKALTLKSAWITKEKQHISPPSDVQAPNQTPNSELSMNAVSNNSISQTEEKSTPSEQKNSSKIRESRKMPNENSASHIDFANKKLYNEGNPRIIHKSFPYPLFGKYVVHMVFDGVSGRDIADTYGLPRQQEVLYLPGTRYKVVSVSVSNGGNPIIFVKEIANNEIQDNDGNLGGQELRPDRNERSDMAVSRGERAVNGGIHGDRRRAASNGIVGQSEVRRSVSIRSDEAKTNVVATLGGIYVSEGNFYQIFA